MANAKSPRPQHTRSRTACLHKPTTQRAPCDAANPGTGLVAFSNEVIQMAAREAAVVGEEDMELRDLLVQTLENSGVLNHIKAELRAAAFLVLEEQEKRENKSPLVNESLKRFLKTRDGHLVASLVAEFLHFFHLDFTLAVFHPEASTSQRLESRENLARALGIIETEGTMGGPLLLEVIKCYQHKERATISGEAAPNLSGRHPPPTSFQGRPSTSTILRKKTGSGASQIETMISSSAAKSKSYLYSLAYETKMRSFLSNTSLDTSDKSDLSLDEDDIEDPSFDDPIAKPEKAYDWRSEARKQAGNMTWLSDVPPLWSGLSFLTGAPSHTGSEYKRGNSVLKDLKFVSDKIGTFGLGIGEGNDYVDDFISGSHYSDKSNLSIEEIEEDLSVGVDDNNTSDKLNGLTQDLTVSQFSDFADYLEDIGQI